MTLHWKITQERPLRWSLCAPPAAVCVNVCSDGEEWVVTCLGETHRRRKTQYDLAAIKVFAVDIFRQILGELLDAEVET